jgi:hypothetical protein
MDAPRATAEIPSDISTLSRPVILAVLAASLMVGAFAITTQSYWIDEAFSLVVATAQSPAEAWKYAQAVSGSTLQMPLYQTYLYTWHKIFGGGEWAMRASNLPWFVLGQLAFLVLLRHRPRLALLSCLLAAVAPVLWISLDETRPYIMQYAAACWLAAALVRLCEPRADDAAPLALSCCIAIAAAAVVLFASSLLGAVWAVSFVLAMLVVRHGRSARRPVVITAALLFAAFAAYYAFTWSDAARGYHRSGASLLSLPFVAYELLGFSGFGPGKLQLRTEPVRSLLRSLPALLPLAATMALFAVFALTHLPRRPWNRRAIFAWGLALGLPSLVIFLGAFVFDYRPLPHNFIPAVPPLLFALASLMQRALEHRSVFWRAAAALLPLLWLASSLNFRWQPVHAKDNYRDAAALAAAALRDNKEVWWAADPAAAYIYLTPVTLEEMPGRAWAMQAPSWNDIRFKFPPRVIVISKPHIFDPQGSVARYAAENRFVPARQLQAFTIFTREGEELPAIGTQ